MPSPPHPAAPHDDLAHADLGIVYATPIELKPFLDRCERVRSYSGNGFTFHGGRFDDIRVVCVATGMGGERARQGTHALIDAHTPRWVLSAGFAGAIRPELHLRDILVPSTLLAPSQPPLTIDMKMPANPAHGLHVGGLITMPEMVRTVAEKQSLAETSPALGVDMETYDVATVCGARHIRFMSVRVISDDLSADLPPEVLTIVGATGSLRLGAAIGALFKRPSAVQDMWRLRETALACAERLAGFLEGVVIQLHAAP